MLHTFLLIAWFALPVLVWGAMLCVRRRLPPVLVWIVCLASMIGGIFILANYVWALDAQLLAEVDKYDPDTPEGRRASEAWASDTDRSFTLLLSPLLTAVLYGGLFLLLFGVQRVVRQMFPARYASVQPSTDSKTAVRRVDDGNPYQPPTDG